jgi:hypothetical protein
VIDDPDGMEIEVTDDYFFGDYQEVHFEKIHNDIRHSYKFFTHINRRFEIGQVIKIKIPSERLVFCEE